MGSSGKWALLIESDEVDYALQFVYADARGDLLQEANLKLQALGFILTSHKTNEGVDPETVPGPSEAELRTQRRQRTPLPLQPNYKRW